LRGCQIEKGTKSGEELRDEVKKVSPDDHAALGDDGLDMVFTMGKIRKEGNAAAHEASKEELRLSVLDPDLGDSERECLGKIYNFMIIEEPTMPIRRATSSRSR
jgi:hypothetical protein